MIGQGLSYIDTCPRQLLSGLFHSVPRSLASWEGAELEEYNRSLRVTRYGPGRRGGGSLPGLQGVAAPWSAWVGTTRHTARS